jgi:hypothetical protein
LTCPLRSKTAKPSQFKHGDARSSQATERSSDG